MDAPHSSSDDGGALLRNIFNCGDGGEILFNVLDEREQKIIQACLGLNGQSARTLLEIGRELGLGRERIGQLHGIALKKLRRALLENKDPQRLCKMEGQWLPPSQQ